MPIVFKQVTPDEHQKYTAIRDITMTCADECTITEMYDAFDSFLRACGYQVPTEDEQFDDRGYNPQDVVFERELNETELPRKVQNYNRD